MNPTVIVLIGALVALLVMLGVLVVAMTVSRRRDDRRLASKHPPVPQFRDKYRSIPPQRKPGKRPGLGPKNLLRRVNPYGARAWRGSEKPDLRPPHEIHPIPSKKKSES